MLYIQKNEPGYKPNITGPRLLVSTDQNMDAHPTRNTQFANEKLGAVGVESQRLGFDMGVSENSVPHCTQWFCWSLSLLNGYNWEYTLFSDKPIWFLLMELLITATSIVVWSPLSNHCGFQNSPQSLPGLGLGIPTPNGGRQSIDLAGPTRCFCHLL